MDLAFDERTEKGRHRRGGVRDAEGQAPGGRGKTVVALLLTFVLLGGLGGGVWYGFDRIQGCFTRPTTTAPAPARCTIEIKDGDSLTDIGNTLVDADVVKSAKAFIDAAEDELAQQEHPAGLLQGAQADERPRRR